MRSETELVRTIVTIGMAIAGHDEARKQLPQEFRKMSDEELIAVSKALDWVVEYQ